MKKFNVVLASALAMVMVLGAGVSASAHTHAFSVMSYCASSSPAGAHSYVVATHTDNKGHVTYEYGTCSMVNDTIITYEKCGCGQTRNSHSSVITRHMNCGQ